MCGIVGLLKGDKADDMDATKLMAQLLFADTLRGNHGTGLVRIDKNADYEWHKRALSGADFLQMGATNKLLLDYKQKAWGYIGHNRLATHGEKSDDHAHPFDTGRIVLVHNGMITAHNQIIPKEPYFAVDSEAVAHAIEKLGAIPALEKLEGAYALVWWDTDEQAIFMARNDARPLHYVITKDRKMLLYASEADLLRWICKRNEVEYVSKSPLIVAPGVLLRIPVGSIEPEIAGKFKPFVKTTHWQHNPNPGNYGGNHRNFPGPQKGISPPIPGTSVIPANSLGAEVQAEVQRLNQELFNKKEAFLKKHGLKFNGKLAGSVRIRLDDPNAKARPHMLYITAGNGNAYDVRSNGTVDRKINNGHEVIGDIVGVSFEQRGTGPERPVIWITNVIALEEYLNKGEPVINEDIIDTTWKEPLYRSKPMDLHKFRAITKRGCIWCQDPVDFSDLPTLLWTSKEEPVCKECQEWAIEQKGIAQAH